MCTVELLPMYVEIALDSEVMATVSRRRPSRPLKGGRRVRQISPLIYSKKVEGMTKQVRFVKYFSVNGHFSNRGCLRRPKFIVGGKIWLQSPPLQVSPDSPTRLSRPDSERITTLFGRSKL